MGRPTASLVVVLDCIPKAVSEIKLNRDERAVVVYKVPLFVSLGRVYRRFEVFLGDVAFSPSIQWDSSFEDCFCS